MEKTTNPILEKYKLKISCVKSAPEQERENLCRKLLSMEDDEEFLTVFLNLAHYKPLLWVVHPIGKERFLKIVSQNPKPEWLLGL